MFSKRVMFRAVTACLMLPLLAGPGLSEPLTQAKLKALFPGSFTAIYKGYQIRLDAHANGKLVGSYRDLQDAGRWRIANNQLCISFDDWLDGSTRCSQVKRSDKWLIANSVRFRRR